MRVRKKPVEVEAQQITEDNLHEVAEWCDGFAALQSIDHERPHINIYTLEGTMRGEVGDWIIKGVNGEFYPCRPNIFEKTYDVINDEPIGDHQIRVESLVENEDGSANITFEMDAESTRMFAKIGMMKVLVDAANRAIEEHGR